MNDRGISVLNVADNQEINFTLFNSFIIVILSLSPGLNCPGFFICIDSLHLSET